jgi:hypothetical protein
MMIIEPENGKKIAT